MPLSQEPLFSCPPKKNKLFTHVAILSWVDGSLVICSQERIEGTTPNHPNRVMFRTHKPGTQPHQEAHSLAMAIANKQSKEFMPIPPTI